jgi:uncharacterized protein (TIGR02145 family)
MKPLKLLGVLSFLVLIMLVSCKKELNNPFDSACPPDFWTPEAFTAVQSGGTVALSWTQEITHISGFKIERKASSGTWEIIATVEKNFSSHIDSDLIGNVLHEYRLYAYAGSNQSNSIQIQITPVLTDGLQGTLSYHGVNYKTVWIDGRNWLAENLRTTKYRDNSDITTGLTPAQWNENTSGAYTVYPHSMITGLNSVTEVLNAYGALYNHYAVTSSKGLCPADWHVATEAEINSLINYGGGVEIAGGKLKSTRTAPTAHPRWDSPNTAATDHYGFSGLPGGFFIGQTNEFGGLGLYGYWWCETSGTDPDFGKAFLFGYNAAGAISGQVQRSVGFPVRCIRNI